MGLIDGNLNGTVMNITFLNRRHYVTESVNWNKINDPILDLTSLDSTISVTA
jgi:hypothetical protein